MKLAFLGGAKEVGRVAIALRAGGNFILLDYGVTVDQEPLFPMHVAPKDVDAIILSHCHLDHSGATPALYVRGGKPVYGTSLTFELSELLISDFIKIAGYYLPYEYVELQTMMYNCVNLNYGESAEVKGISFKLLNSGHVPGSAQAILEADGKRLLYTGDFNTRRTRLLKGADLIDDELDAVVIEGTYANEDHPNRADVERDFVNAVREVAEGGGTILVPAFSVGRSQEILCVLYAHRFEHPISLDGMAKEASQILLRHASSLLDPRLYAEAARNAYWVEDWQDRRVIARRPGVIISPAGMLKGGPAAFYLSEVGRSDRNAVFLVSYQIRGTPGRELLDKGACTINGREHKVKASVRRFDFSSHCGASELIEFLRRLKGSPTVYVVHADEENSKLFVKRAQEEVGLKAVAPNVGEVYDV